MTQPLLVAQCRYNSPCSLSLKGVSMDSRHSGKKSTSPNQGLDLSLVSSVALRLLIFHVMRGNQISQAEHQSHMGREEVTIDRQRLGFGDIWQDLGSKKIHQMYIRVYQSVQSCLIQMPPVGNCSSDFGRHASNL